MARLYLRPVQFVDTPVGRDGEVARLAGGLSWFAAWELIVREDGRRIAQRTIPVASLPDASYVNAYKIAFVYVSTVRRCLPPALKT